MSKEKHHEQNDDDVYHRDDLCFSTGVLLDSTPGHGCRDRETGEERRPDMGHPQSEKLLRRERSIVNIRTQALITDIM